MNKQLIEALKQEDTVLFVGSGISCWSGLPSWWMLLDKLATYLEGFGRDSALVRKEMKHDLLQAASYGFDQLTTTEIATFIRETCKLSEQEPHEIHQKLVTLGPRCFITTNYDTLIEESLKMWHPHRSVRKVTNRQPLETPDILQSRSLDFVFKPHGDIDDMESLVLTREQYRKLLDGGEWKHAHESLRTLMVTRRVVYFGFGLRDPDFMLLRDLLANIWKGGIQDHYAIMADVSASEISYWRKNYNIHLISYDTTYGGRNHSKLLDLLNEVHQARSAVTNTSHDSDALRLCLLRHSNSLIGATVPTPEFPLRLRRIDESKRVRTRYDSFDQFNGSSIETFLEQGPKNAVLLGLPGSGKSCRLRRSAAKLAQSVHDQLLSDSPKIDSLIIPFYADLKLYEGSLQRLLESSLPPGFSFEQIVESVQVKIFLDSFNEMRKDYWERGDYQTDFSAFFQTFPDVSVIVASRTDDGLSGLKMPMYSLDEIDSHFLDEELSKLGVSIDDHFRHEILRMLQKPLFFELVSSGKVKLPPGANPGNLLDSYFSNLSKIFTDHFGCEFDLKLALQNSAYEAINRGEEAQPAKNLLQSIKCELQSQAISSFDEMDVLNWLISRDVVLPYTRERVSFFHQSVTEYLAAGELARRYIISPEILTEKITFKRWDQAILLTLSVLPNDMSALFLNTLVEIDFSMAMKAVKYLEYDQTQTITLLLAKIIDKRRDFSQEMQLAWTLENHVPVTSEHVPILKKIFLEGNRVGAVAAFHILELEGPSAKQELLESMLHRKSDFNYCDSLGRALAPFMAEEGDLQKLVEIIDSVEGQGTEGDEDESDLDGFIHGAAGLIKLVEPKNIAKIFIDRKPNTSIPMLRYQILCAALRGSYSTESLNIVSELLLKGSVHAAYAIFSIGNFNPKDNVLCWDIFESEHVDRLMQFADQLGTGTWAFSALRCISVARPDLIARIKEHLDDSSLVKKIAIVWAVSSNREPKIFELLSEICSLTADDFKREPIALLGNLELDWTGNESLFIRLLKLRDSSLAWKLLESVEEIGQLNIDSIFWWLDWIGEDCDFNDHWWFTDRLCALFDRHLDPKHKEEFLAEFNTKSSHYRSVLARTILLKSQDLTIDMLSSDAIEFLLEDLKNAEFHHWQGHLLGRVATEEFAEERLITLLNSEDRGHAKNVAAVLEHAGKRHGRRYLAKWKPNKSGK